MQHLFPDCFRLGLRFRNFGAPRHLTRRLPVGKVTRPLFEFVAFSFALDRPDVGDSMLLTGRSICSIFDLLRFSHLFLSGGRLILR